MEFFRLSLQKIVIAKAIGIPLLIMDILFNIFSYFQWNILVKLALLIVFSYSLSCTIDSILKKSNIRVKK